MKLILKWILNQVQDDKELLCHFYPKKTSPIIERIASCGDE